MKFVVSSTSLLKNLQSISGVLVVNSTLPILDNFLFSVEDGNVLTVSASDMETTMTTSFSIEEAADFGKVCIPAKILLEVLKNLPEQPLTFTVDENFHIEIAYTNGKSQMSGYDSDHYPRFPKIDSTDHIVLEGGVIAEAINKTLFAAGNDELRPTMNGVFCQLSTEDITFVATDAHKLVKYRRTDSQGNTISSFILPRKALNLLKANLKGDEEVKLEYNETNAVFTFNDTTLTCRLVEGKYPNYEAVIPKENPNVLTVDRLSFLSCVKRVAIFANKTTNQINLKIAGSELSISAEDIDFSNASNERMTCSYEGEDMEIAFNSRFLVEMLNNLASNDIKIMMSQPNRAGILMPSEIENESEEVLMLIMPLMINR